MVADLRRDGDALRVRAVFPDLEAVLPERFSTRGRKRPQAVVGLPPRPLTRPLPKSARP